MTFPIFYKAASLAVLTAAFAFADNVVLYNTVSNTTSTAGANTVSFGVQGTNANMLVGTNIAMGVATLGRQLTICKSR